MLSWLDWVTDEMAASMTEPDQEEEYVTWTNQLVAPIINRLGYSSIVHPMKITPFVTEPEQLYIRQEYDVIPQE